jgi:glycosyltransferase involved in cell wall biosynthesis
MRVLLICHAYGTPIFQQKIQLLDAMPDVEMGLVVPRQWGETLHKGAYQVLPNATYRVFPVRTHHGNNVWSFFYNPLDLLRAVLAFRPHIIHAEQEPWSLPLFQVALLKALMPWRKLTFFTWENIHKVYPRPYRWFEVFNFALSDVAIAGNQEAADVLKGKGYGYSIVLPQMGVDTDRFRPNVLLEAERSALRTELGLEGFVVGYFGRFEKGKGLQTLLRGLSAWDVPWTLLMVGAGPLRDELPNFAAHLGIAERIKWMERVPPEALPRYYSVLDAFVLASETHAGWKEQFGRVLVEAMACGVPVIGSTSGAIPEVVGQAGLLFPERDHVALAAALETLRAGPERRQHLAEAGRSRAQERYSNRTIAERTAKIYRALVD